MAMAVVRPMDQSGRVLLGSIYYFLVRIANVGVGHLGTCWTYSAQIFPSRSASVTSERPRHSRGSCNEANRRADVQDSD